MQALSCALFHCIISSAPGLADLGLASLATMSHEFSSKEVWNIETKMLWRIHLPTKNEASSLSALSKRAKLF